MPNADTILWAGISGLILIMLGVIGYLIDNGFTSLKEDLKEELKKLWEKIDLHQATAERNALDIIEIKTRCKELHRNHRRTDDSYEG